MTETARRPDCRQIVAWTTEWMEKSLEEEPRSLFVAHLDECEACARFVTQMSATTNLVGESAAAEKPAPEGQARVLETVLGSAASTQGGDPESRPDMQTGNEASPLTDEQIPCPELDETSARAYLEDRLPAQEQIAVLEHLIAGCEPCRLACVEVAFPELVGELPERISMSEDPPPPELETRYQKELERLIECHHRGESIEVAAELEPRPYLLWMIRQGRDLTESDPPKSKDIASIVVSVADELDADSQVRAAMLKAVVFRKVDGDYTGADGLFSWAHRQTSEARDLAQLAPKVLSLWAFSKWTRGQPREALDLYRQALDGYLQLGDLARWGECSVDRVAALQEVDPERAIRSLLGSTALVNWAGRERLAMVSTQYLSYCYLGTDRPFRALVALQACRRHLARFDAARSVELRIDWTEASIVNALESYEEAAGTLRSIRDEFLKLDLPANVAFVSLDLAVSLIGTSSWKELAVVTEPMAAFFLSRGVSGEAAVALGLFRRAVEEQALTIAQVHALRRCLG